MLFQTPLTFTIQVILIVEPCTYVLYSLLFAMKTLSSNGGIKVNDPTLLSQYKSSLLGLPSHSWNFYHPSLSSFTDQAYPFRHHLHSIKRGIQQNKAFLFFSTKKKKKPVCLHSPFIQCCSVILVWQDSSGLYSSLQWGVSESWVVKPKSRTMSKHQLEMQL